MDYNTEDAAALAALAEAAAEDEALAAALAETEALDPEAEYRAQGAGGAQCPSPPQQKRRAS